MKVLLFKKQNNTTTTTTTTNIIIIIIIKDLRRIANDLWWLETVFSFQLIRVVILKRIHAISLYQLTLRYR